MRKVHNSTFNIQNSKFIMGIALGTQIQNTMRPVWAALNKTLIYNWMIHYVIVEKCINTIDDVLIKKAMSFIEYKHIYNSYLK